MKFSIYFCLNSLSFISGKSYESHMKSAYTYDRENQVKKPMIRYKAPVNFAVFLPTPETIVTDIMYNYVFKGIEFSVNWQTLCIHTTHMYIHLFILHTYIHIYERMYVSTVEFFLVKQFLSKMVSVKYVSSFFNMLASFFALECSLLSLKHLLVY